MTRRGLTALAVAVAGAAGALLLDLLFIEQSGISHSRWQLLWPIGLWWGAFGIGLAALLRAPRRPAMVLLVTVAVGLQALTVVNPRHLSDDLYRYAWDGKVQAAGIDPYRYPPQDPRLTSLRDPWLWPPRARCERARQPVPCTRLNRPAARTIYPPVAEAAFWLLDLVRPRHAHERSITVPMGLLALLVTALLALTLQGWGRDPRWAAVWAWSPLGVIETGSEGHIDVLAVLLAVLALRCLTGSAPGATLRRGAAAIGGALLGAAVAVKLYPALLLPPAVRRRPLAVALSALAVVVLGYVPHVLAVGPKVVGYLPGYLSEEGYSGGRFLLLGVLGAYGRVAVAVAVLVVAAAALVALWRARSRPLVDVAVAFVGVAMLVATPVQQWYALLLLALVALSRRWEWLGVAAAGYPLYFAEILRAADPAVIGQLSYGVAALLVVTVLLTRCRPSRVALTPRE